MHVTVTRRIREWLSPDEGVAIFTVVGIMSVLTVLAIGSFTMARQSLHEAARTEDETRAFRAASTGLDREISVFSESPVEWPVTGSTPDGAYSVTLESLGGGEYRLASEGVGVDGSTEIVSQQFYFLNLWKMNFAGTGPQALITGTSGLNGTSNILGPFYMKGNFRIDSNMSVREGPLFVRDGSISVAAAGLLGEPAAPIKVYCDGNVPDNVKGTTRNGVYISTLSRSVPDIALPELDYVMLQQWATKAQLESVDNTMRSAAVDPPRENLEAVASNALSYSTMVPPNSATWTRQRAGGSNYSYKFIGRADGTIALEREGTTGLTIGHRTFGSWGRISTTGATVSGDGHYPDTPAFLNSYDDFAYWDEYTRSFDLLFINGTVFVDGPLVFDDDVLYIGNGSIIVNGDITVNGILRPFGATNTVGEENKWALGLVTPGDITFTVNSNNAYANKTTEELRAALPELAGAFYAEDTVHFTSNNIMVRGSIIAGKINTNRCNTYLITNPLLPTYLPESLPGIDMGLLMPGLWNRG